MITGGLFASAVEWGKIAVVAGGVIFAAGWWWRTRSIADGLKATGAALIAVAAAAFWNNG